MQPMLSRQWSTTTVLEGMDVMEKHVEALRTSELSDTEMLAEAEAPRAITFRRCKVFQALERALEEGPGHSQPVATPARGPSNLPPLAEASDGSTGEEPAESIKEAESGPTLVVEVEESAPITPTQREYEPSLPDRQPDEVYESDTPIPEPPASAVRCEVEDKDLFAPEPSLPKFDSASEQAVSSVHVSPHPEVAGDYIPSLDDQDAPRPELRSHTLSKNAIRCRSGRIFKRRADGSTKVSQEIFNEWHNGGEPRRALEQIFKACGYDPETWL